MKKYILGILLALSFSAMALDLELTQGMNVMLPIGIVPFSGDVAAQNFTSIIENDFRLSGQFKLVPVSQNDWSQSAADSVLIGQVTASDATHLNVHFELFDVASQGKLLFSKNYQISRAELRALAHHVSDEVYQKLTGEKGIFSTKIAYISVNRQQGSAQYSLEVADFDGNNPRSLLISSEPIMSPAWSPDGTQIAYVSFERKRAQIYLVTVASGQRRLVTDFPGINGAPAWAPNGKELALVLSKGGAPKIYRVSLATGLMTQLTFGEAIDTEPSYSPDGKALLFTSGRGGSPQIYRLSFADGSIARVTFEGDYNARASFTPNFKQIVMIHRNTERAFHIGIQNSNGGPISQLTFAPQDESPSIAPNSRLVLYATRAGDQGVLAVVSTDGRIRMRLPARNGDVQEPAWSPYLG